MKVGGRILLAALILAGTAAAGSSGSMVSAMKALHYPKRGAIKLGCRTAGTGFSCKATYRHHRVRRFYAEWQATGGYLCAGTKPSTCKTLPHGFVAGSYAQTDLPGVAEMVTRGYMALKYSAPQPFRDGNCTPSTATNSWSYCYKLDTGSVNITVHLAKTKTGYITTTAAILY